MLPTRALMCLIGMTVAGFGLTAIGEEPSQPDYDALAKQLDSDSFAEREAATSELKKAGEAAFPALQRAALGSSPEAASRAFKIFKAHFESDDEKLQEATRKALDEVANSGVPAATEKANRILDPRGVRRPVNPFGNPNLNAQFQFQFGGGNAGGRRVSSRTVNGVKQIDAEENGEKVKIVDDPANGITVEITKKKNGKEVTEKFSARDRAELKKKHPAADLAYQKYDAPIAIQFRGVGIPRVGRGGFPGGRIPQPLQPRGVPSAERLGQTADQLKEAALELGETIELLENDDDDAVRKAITRLEKLKLQLEQVQQGLER